jgi:hypothetical protein
LERVLSFKDFLEFATDRNSKLLSRHSWGFTIVAPRTFRQTPGEFPLFID